MITLNEVGRKTLVENNFVLLSSAYPFHQIQNVLKKFVDSHLLFCNFFRILWFADRFVPLAKLVKF